jgi:cytochrome b involved in lipid metabolism
MSTIFFVFGVFLQDVLPVLSIQDFIERVQTGNRWVRMRDIIFDITPLSKTHPGGRAVLDSSM